MYYNNISIKGWTSPEGGISINSGLSKKRADAIIEFLSTNVQKKISTIDVHLKEVTGIDFWIWLEGIKAFHFKQKQLTLWNS